VAQSQVPQQAGLKVILKIVHGKRLLIDVPASSHNLPVLPDFGLVGQVAQGGMGPNRGKYEKVASSHRNF
jgi:hypothetical protein